jgi:hypothetical protein
MLLRHSFTVINAIAFIPMVQSLFAHTPQLHIYIAQFPLLPLLTPLCLPFVSLSTYLAPSSCDRNRPPPSQVACKLTPFAPLHPVDPPLLNSQNPTCPAPNNDDLGNILALGVQNNENRQNLFCRIHIDRKELSEDSVLQIGVSSGFISTELSCRICIHKIEFLHDFFQRKGFLPSNAYSTLPLQDLLIKYRNCLKVLSSEN